MRYNGPRLVARKRIGLGRGRDGPVVVPSTLQFSLLVGRESCIESSVDGLQRFGLFTALIGLRSRLTTRAS